VLFQTFDFLVFLALVLPASWALVHRPMARVWLLVFASYFFYMAGPKTDPPPTPWYYAGLLLVSSLLDYVCSLQIDQRKAAAASADPVVAKRARLARNVFLGISLTANLGALGYFKYTGFFLKISADIANAVGMPFAAPTFSILLPVGISFYTFQILSYTIDVWRGQIPAERSFAKFSLFVTFFPQLVAGPIVRASEFLPQLQRPPRLTPEFIDEGLFRIFKGIIKKILFGDWIATQLTDAIFATPENYTSAEILIALYAFTLQLYADFSGYSDIAIGVSRLFGYEISENFDRPYQSRDIGEFWRRWHMTLSTWLRDYVFFPLGGSRCSPARTYFNLWLTMFLVGMWHYSPGTSWNFVIYANLHAGAMLFNRWNRIRNRNAPLVRRILIAALLLTMATSAMFGLGRFALDLTQRQSIILAAITAGAFAFITWLPTTETRLNTAVHILFTFHFTVLSRVFFRAESFDVAKQMVSTLLSFDGHLLRPGLVSISVWAALLVGLAYHYTPKAWVDRDAFAVFRRIPGLGLGLLFAALCLALRALMDSAPRAFIYFQF